MYDLIAIGGGSGGIATCNRAAEHGAKVAVVEDQELGGTCVNIGCVPKKATWYAAEINQAIHRYGPGYGFQVQESTFDYQEFRQARQAYIERSRASYTSTFAKNGVEVIRGRARFISPQEIEVNGQRYQAKHFVIASGAYPLLPDVPGADLLETSDDFFEWEELPESVAVIGAGYIAVELASALAALEVETHLAMRYEYPLRTFDHMLQEELLAAMEDHGPELYVKTNFDEYRRNSQGQIECLVDGEVLLTVDRVIAAIGRRPNTADLGLDQAGVDLGDNQAIRVNDHLETSQPGIYALGDVIEKVQLTPVAIRQGRLLAEHLFNQGPAPAINYDLIPTVVFTHPPLATMGLTEAQAVSRYGEDEIVTYESRFIAMYASVSGHREPCRFKLVCHKSDQERILGIHGIGHGVDEMLQGFGVALMMGATKADFDSVVAIHPTGAEEFVTMR